MKRNLLRNWRVERAAVVALLVAVVIAAALAGVDVLSVDDGPGHLDRSDHPAHSDHPQERNRLAVETATVHVTEDETVDSVTLTVVGGTTDIDIAASTVEWLGPNAARTLVHGNRSASDAAGSSFAPGESRYFTSAVLRDRDGSAPVLDGPDDRFAVVVNATAVGGRRLESGDSVSLKLITSRGAVTRYDIVIPHSLDRGTTVAV